MANHWGWWWKVKQKYIPKKLCSNFDKIDSFDVFKSVQNKIAVGFTTEDPQKGKLNSLKLQAALENDHLKITHGNNKKHSYAIPIAIVPCFFGNARTYFKCPSCLKRMRILYRTNGAFLCRNCLNLGYESQRLRPTLRFQAKQKKIASFIENKDGELPFKKPPRMRMKTFEKHIKQANQYEQKAEDALNQELRTWFGAKAEPYLDSWFDYEDESLK